MSKLSDALAKKEFIITGEIAPPKGVNVAACIKEAEDMSKKAVAINVTDLQSSVMKAGSLIVSQMLKSRGIEPVFQMTCRDRNRLALQSDLLSASIAGIENVLCLTGDYVSFGDHPQAKPVFDLDSVQLLKAAAGLMEGADLAGKKLDGAPKFFLGGVCTPLADPIEPQIIKMEKKIKAGAKFFQTQAVFDVAQFARFLEQAKYLNVPVIAGIVVLKSAGMAKFMNANVSGIKVPDALIKEMETTQDKVKTGISIAARIIKELKPLCQGIHIMPLGWGDKVGRILEEAGL